MSGNPCWYLVQCKPGEGFRAEEHLKNQKYTCFHPTFPVKRKIGTKVQVRVASLFPHYLFVLLDDTNNWAPIRSTRGVKSIVRFNGIPAKLEVHLIEELIQYCAKLHSIEAEPLYKSGDRVVITRSCFKELEAVITAISGEERVILLLNLCNRPQQIELSVSSISMKE